MQILAILQNQWFREPKRVQALYDERPEIRNELIKRFLFMGCVTGRRLKTALGESLCNSIVWEEASLKVGGHSSSKFEADLNHIKGAIQKHEPDVIICFGKIAGDALRNINPSLQVLYAPHPAARNNPIPALKAVAERLNFPVKE